MKIRPSIYLFLAIAVALVAFVFWHGKRRPESVAVNAVVETDVTSPAATATNVSINMPILAAAASSNLATNATQTLPQGKWEQKQSILATQNDVPIIFYGRVIDQFGDGVANAAVNFSIGVYNGYESTEKKGQVMTDDNGLFNIGGYKGYNLGIMPEKTGYVIATQDTLFNYSHLESNPYVPNQNNPTVIQMYKLQGAEKLTSFNIKANIPVDGTPIRFDFQTGQQVQNGGDLTISLQSSPEPRIQEGYDWHASITMNGGGVIQDTSGLGLDKMFQAPDSGYESEFNLSFQKGTQQWTPRFVEGFYFTIQNGKEYGKMAVSIITDRIINGGASISINGYLNPTGSRNLEIGERP